MVTFSPLFNKTTFLVFYLYLWFLDILNGFILLGLAAGLFNIIHLIVGQIQITNGSS